MAYEERVNKWREVLDRYDLTGRDLLIDRGHGYFVRGPIEKIWISKANNGDWVLKAKLRWVARKIPRYHQWIWVDFEYDRTIIIGYVQYSDPQFTYEGITSSAFNGKTILSEGNNIDPSGLYTEYFVEVQVRHHLYPPRPFDDIKRVGIVHNVVPAEPTSQEKVEICAITFAMAATSYKSAKQWCIDECKRLGLPIVRIKKSYLLPGY